ncbi:MAG: bifunctional isocitrate dehydrogenase kinase/phosphatase [Gammaproteobacteria bacterium]|nr:bifunctional isocitrate dehydrogenase kinase/phosphatase [Gammaproteobacteria bacterium]NIN39666.1 bifunctional isocitrate dehydrogenase kinase/phosphatase [Gammaproteobacteria bacterium]NIO25223.1 bifunctional isocitrate dehydrogenase kinase/phosphatase [Gammaproteobacteria bacterium]NIO65852.1 bifunctional isocitrate dehydrogenase kinase/phosphatase [Gammaproteobacteria bacterium]NIP45712.1 bifunctional isocitrate dehydrogenase kinase/phosphatase [Gammaproteobacteria bacterium]
MDSDTFDPLEAETHAEHASLIAGTANQGEKVALAADWILQAFAAYYTESRDIPALAEKAFEARDHATSLELSKRRLALYSIAINSVGMRLKKAFPRVANDESLWREIEGGYLPLIEGRYEADLAFAFLNSVKRRIHQGEWQPVEYAFGGSDESMGGSRNDVYRRFSCATRIDPDTVTEILAIPGFTRPFQNSVQDGALVAERINRAIASRGATGARAVEMLNAGFFRNRGGYIVGRVVLEDGNLFPFIIALLNDEDGIYVDAVLSAEADAHNIFSSTLANFHVTNNYYHELSQFLHSIMPTRPLGLHYSTIGFNHVGKVAVMNELKEELSSANEVLETAVGFRGTVAIGFSSPRSAYNLKVIRDKPTASYKWGTFEGIESVMKKYGQVHEINRTGSMLDNIIYYNLKLDRSWFDPALLEELLEEASETVSLRGDSVILKYLIVQRRMTPLPVFLETATEAQAETAIINLGYCIKNNAAANIFNKDLDARNYGVSRFIKVYLFDYDALEPFTDVKIRSNEGRIDGEEEPPDWFFEDGVVFLPEEIEAGLMIPNRHLRRLFRQVHGDLLSTEYWQRVQDDLREGKVPSVRIYPESCELARSGQT